MKNFATSIVVMALGIVLAMAMPGCVNAGEPAAKAPPSTNQVPAGIGFNMHVLGTDQDWDAIKAAGAKFVRTDFAWGGIEKVKGQYDFSTRDKQLDALSARGLRAIYILDYRNKLYGNPETTDEGRDAYARWAAAAARHFQGRGVIWEIWNEPNVGFWKGNGKMNSVEFADDYVTLVKKTVPAMRAADPGCYIVGGSVSCLWKDSFRWIDEAFQQGLLQTGINALSVHPYGFPFPEKCIEPGYGVLRQKMQQAAAPANFPVLNTEVGFPTKWKKGTLTRTLDEQAMLIVRQHLVDQMCGVRMSIYYNWDEVDAADHKIRSNGPEPLPVYSALQNMSAELAGYRFVERLNVGSDDDFVLVFMNVAKDRKIVVWTAPHRIQDAPAKELPTTNQAPVAEPPVAKAESIIHDVTIPTGIAAGPITVRDMYGKPVSAKAQTDAVTLSLTGRPQYIDLAAKPQHNPSPK